MAATGLKQSALAELMGVPLDRVKSLATGKVKKFTQGEGEALVRKLNVRAEWLVTGEGPMFQESQERELHARVDAVQTATKKASIDGLSRDEVARLQELLFFVETRDAVGVRRVMSAPPTDEQMLLDAYRAMDAAGKKALLSAALGVSPPASVAQNNQGDNAIQVAHAAGKVSIKRR